MRKNWWCLEVALVIFFQLKMLWINDITYTSLHFYIHDTLPFQTCSAEINLRNVLWNDPA